MAILFVPGVVKAPDRATLFDGERDRESSGDGERSCRRLFLPGEVCGEAREREGVWGSTGIAGGSVLDRFAGLDPGSMEVFLLEANG